MQTRLYPVPEVAKILGIGRTTTYHLIKTGELKAVKVGGCRRVSSIDLEDFITALRQGESS